MKFQNVMNSKTKIIIILGLILGIVFLLTNDEIVRVETVTKVKYIPIYDVKEETKPISIEPKIIKIPIKVPNDTIRDTIYKEIHTKKYSFRDTLKNGVIESTILADNIYKRDIKLTTNDKVTTIETTKTIFKSNFFVGGSVNMDLNNQINQAALNGYYVHKDVFIVGAGIGYDLIQKKPITNITLAIKL